MKYPALFDPAEEGGFVITFADWDWGVTQGEDEADALDMAQDALITMIAHSIRHGKPVPPPKSTITSAGVFARTPMAALTKGRAIAGSEK